ncbi:MAG: peptidoglycan D,D-transpeptidase FtsI family protein [Planctomycetota bacterium]
MRAAIPAPAQPGRTWLVISAFALVAGLVVWRLYDLQVRQAGTYMHLAERQETRTWSLPAARGSIRDIRGRELAASRERWNLFADPDYMDDKLGATIALSRLLDLPRAELRQHFDSGSNGRLLARGLTRAQMEAVAELDLAGVYTRLHYQRDYPQGSVAASVIGFLRADGSGAGGIESRFDANLTGVPGRRLVRVDAHGRPLLTGVDGEVMEVPRPGQHVQLTIDADLQARAEELLGTAIAHHQARAGAVIAIRPETGAIAAMASWPTFDLLQARNEGLDDIGPTRNQAIQIVYESGSTMKPLVAGAAVAEGLASWEERVFCENGRWTYRHGRAARTIRDHSFKHGGHQWLTVAEGVAKSDNVLMAKLGIRLGPERLFRWVRHFGFGQKTGIDLAGESAGVVHPLRLWTPTGACMSVPIGHEFSVTPLQMALMHAAVANRGLWNPPRLVDRIFTLDPSSGRIRDLDVPPMQQPRRIFASRDALAIQDAMRLVMEEGTGRRAQLDGYSSAGKTGTTEKLIDGRYADDRHIGSFVAWAPASRSHRAELLVLCVIDDPQRNGHYGSQTAAPVVQELLQYGLDEVYRVPPDRAVTEVR